MRDVGLGTRSENADRGEARGGAMATRERGGGGDGWREVEGDGKMTRKKVKVRAREGHANSHN